MAVAKALPEFSNPKALPVKLLTVAIIMLIFSSAPFPVFAIPDAGTLPSSTPSMPKVIQTTPSTPATPSPQPPATAKVFDFKPGSPSAIVYNMVKRAIDPGLSNVEREGDQKTYFSLEFQRFIAALKDHQWRDFDADILTGVQDYSDFIIKDVITDVGKDVIVTVMFSSGDHVIKVDYLLVQDGNLWKVQDVGYHEGKDQTFREAMSSEASNADSPSKSSGDDTGKASPKRITVFKGRCRLQIVQGFFPCDSRVTFVELSNGRSFISFTKGRNTFSVSGGKDGQPNLENYYQSLDTMRFFERSKMLAENTGMEGECHFSLNKAGTRFYFLKCDIFNRSKGIGYNFYLEQIVNFSRKDFN